MQMKLLMIWSLLVWVL